MHSAWRALQSSPATARLRHGSPTKCSKPSPLPAAPHASAAPPLPPTASRKKTSVEFAQGTLAGSSSQLDDCPTKHLCRRSPAFWVWSAHRHLSASQASIDGLQPSLCAVFILCSLVCCAPAAPAPLPCAAGTLQGAALWPPCPAVHAVHGAPHVPRCTEGGNARCSASGSG